MTDKEFRAFTESKIVILDGATGSNLQKRGMPAGVCPEKWMMEHPDAVIELQRQFLEAGTDILFAPTFTSNRIKLKEYGQQDRIGEYNNGLIELSRQAVSYYRNQTGSDRKIFIAADLTMTGEMPAPTGKLSFKELVDVYKEQIGYILTTGVDLFVIETMMSLQECRAALLAAKELCDLPVMVSLTYQENSRTLYGTDPGTAVIVLQGMGADAVGVNCSTGPDKIHGIIRQMKEVAYVPIMAKPNAGIPKLIDGRTVFPMMPEEFASEMLKLVKEGTGIIGGCCGSTPEHIERMVETVKGFRPPEVNSRHPRALTTEQKTVEIDLNGRFLVIGERINPTGKKALQEKLRAGELSPVSDMALEQIRLGADLLDINVGMSGVEEKELMLQVVTEVLKVCDVPLCIDSSRVDVIEAVLRIYPGRALINSISLEREKYEKLIPIAKKYGAMFILLPLSDHGLPKDLDEKKQIIHKILNRAYELGLTGEDIIVDGLVTTIGANKNAAYEAMDTIRYCRQELGLATSVGLSNISYGLPQRQYINSTFLSFAIQSGLTMAIANPSQDLFRNTALAADLLFGREGAAQRYIDMVAEPKDQPAGNIVAVMQKPANDNRSGEAAPDRQLPKENAEGYVPEAKAIYQAVLRGNNKEIVALTKQELKRNTKPGEIIDGILIPAINEVGRLFDKQIYFLPQLIAGAEAMKLAIDYLEPMLKDNKKEKSRGTVVIATVSGDIHDIGKNLVALMLKNYGYRVIDLGKDVKTEKILQTAREEAADIIAVSALMTTTMTVMKEIVAKVREEKLPARVIIGGAVITDSYAEEIGADGYAPDARSAVELVKGLTGRKQDNM